MPTGARGESILTVGGQEHRILMTNRALAEAEKLTGKSTVLLANSAREMDISLNDLAILLRGGMEAARRDSGNQGRSVLPTDAFDLMDAAGFTKCAMAVIEALAAVLAYDPDDEGGEAEANPPA
jgi:hypothetical protein